MFEKFRNIKLDQHQERLWKTLVFLARLLILSVPLYLILAFASLLWLQYLVAVQSVWILNLLGVSTAQNGAFLTTGDFIFLISPDCTGWKSALFLFALIFAIPRSSLKRRLIGLGIGLPLIWVGNLARIVGVVAAERTWGLETAMLIHDYLWQIGLVLVVLIIWSFWLKWNLKQINTNI